jgi:hypothetical protein
MRKKNVLVRRPIVAALLTAIAGVGVAITAPPASALPPKCSENYIRQLQEEEDFWANAAQQWEDWANEDAADHDWSAYALDIHNEKVAMVEFSFADQRLAGCLV